MSSFSASPWILIMYLTGPIRLFGLVRPDVVLMAAILGLGTFHLQVAASQQLIVVSDGKEIAVEELEIDDVRLACLSNGKPIEFPVEKVASIRNAVVAKVDSIPPYLLGLNDGSKIRTNKILFDGDATTIGGLDDNDWTFSRRDIAWIRLDQNPPEAIDRNWQELLDREDRAGDWLVFSRDDQLDFLEGLVGNISESTVEFTANGQSNQAPRNRVVGIVFFHGVRKTFAPAVGRLRTVDGDEFPVSKAVFKDGAISLTTIGGIDVEIPTTKFLEFEASKQKFVIVSKLRPTTVEWKPLIANAGTSALQEKWNRPRFDTSFESETLGLRFPASERSWSSYRLVEYSHGIAAKTGTRVVFEIDREFSRLLGIAGFAPELQLSGSADLIIIGDGAELFRQTFNQDVSEPVPLVVDLQGVQRLTLQIDYRNGTGFGGVFHLCDLRLER